MQIDNFTILKLSQNILKRFEHNLKGGTMVLYNLETKAIWFGNSASRELIKLLDGNRNLEEIYIEILANYNEELHDKIIESLNIIIEDLVKQKFIL